MAQVAVAKSAPERGAERRFPGFGLFRPSLFPFESMWPFDNGPFWMSLFKEGEPGAWMPAVEIKKKNGDLEVTAELPGIKKEDIKLEVCEGNLTIEGERKHEEKEEREGYFRSERRYGHFYRSIGLPEGAETDKIKAELKDGILNVVIPVPEAKEASRKIAIK
jgi:HSP20 family molecular chaperone IbpA